MTEDIKNYLSIPSFEDFVARPTFGLFERRLQEQKAELESLRSSLVAFGYNA